MSLTGIARDLSAWPLASTAAEQKTRRRQPGGPQYHPEACCTAPMKTPLTRPRVNTGRGRRSAFPGRDLDAPLTVSALAHEAR